MHTPIFPDFPRDEYDARYQRARELMGEHDIDALLITEELNYIYFTGHRSQQNVIDKIRPYVFVLPREDEGILITMPFELETVQGMSWVSEIRTATGLIGNVDLIADVLKKKGLANARIGAELGREQYLGISYNDFEGLRKALSGATFVDGAPILLKLRACKSRREVAYMRRAAEITVKAEIETLNSIHAGMTEHEIGRTLRMKLAELGGERVTFLIVRTGPLAEGGMLSVPTDRKIRRGDTVMLDTGVEYRGYCSDIARTAVVGKPSAEVDDFYAWYMQTRNKCDVLLRAGNSPSQVFSAYRDAVETRGMPQRGVGRVGHGVGLETTEFPSLSMDEKILLEPGMVLACNPNFVRPFGFINCEDNWVITEGAPELLSSPSATTAVHVVSA